VSGIRNAEDDAISPKVHDPVGEGVPEEPRIVKAVMFVPKSDIRNTNGPSERLARK